MNAPITPDLKLPPGASAQWSNWSDAHLVALTRDTRWLSQPVADDWFDSRPHLLMLYTIAKWVCWPDPRMVRPRCAPHCLEIGVRHGMSSIALLHAMRETGGMLVSLECDPHWCAASRRLIEGAGLESWWDLQCINSNDYKPAFETLDLLWIDGDHSRAQAERDVRKYAPLVRINGFLLMHDYWSLPCCADPPVQDPASHVSEVVEEVLRPSGEWEIINLPWAHGLTIARRVRS